MRKLWLKHLLIKYTLDLHPVYFAVMCISVGLAWVFYERDLITLAAINAAIASFAEIVLLFSVMRHIKRSLHKSYEQFIDEYEKPKRINILEENGYYDIETETTLTTDPQAKSTAWFD